MDAALFVLALLGAAAALKNPNTTLLGSWPMIHAHDAATTYLSTGIVDEWAKTQQDGGVASLFGCGARALDWRPSLKDGVLQMHHGDIDIEYAMSDALDEAVAWANAHVDVEDLVLLVISHEDGDGAHAAVLELLGTAGVAYVDDCAGLYSTTVAAAADAARLPGGGRMMAISGTCVTGHWDSSITCAGFKSRRLQETTATNATAANGAVDFPWYYTCYADSSSKDYPLDRFWTYYESVVQEGPVGGGLYTVQALWQEDADSVVVSGLHGATLLTEESESGLNALVTARIKAEPDYAYGMVEVNNVCDGGPGLLDALRAL